MKTKISKRHSHRRYTGTVPVPSVAATGLARRGFTRGPLARPVLLCLRPNGPRLGHPRRRHKQIGQPWTVGVYYAQQFHLMSRRQRPARAKIRETARVSPATSRTAPIRASGVRRGLFVTLGALLVCGAAAVFWRGTGAEPTVATTPPPATNTAPAAPASPATAVTSTAQPPAAPTNPNTAAAKPEQSNTAIDLNQEANKLLEAGDLAGAIQLYEKAIATTPEDEDLHYNLGIAYAKAGQNEKAEKQYREALQLLPDYAEVHNNLGNLLLRTARLQEAEEQFNEAISDMPDYAAAHNNLGIVRQRQKRLAEATACFEKAVRYDTNYFEAHYNLATAYAIDHQPDKALPEFREALRLNPTFEPAQRALAKIGGQAPVTTP